MKGNGGNIVADIQKLTVATNEIGEHEEIWATMQQLKGWLDLMAGDSRYTSFNAKIQESTHVFVADYVPLVAGLDARNVHGLRMIIKGQIYDILLMDNPMEMETGSQWEIYLKYIGGQ